MVKIVTTKVCNVTLENKNNGLYVFLKRIIDILLSVLSLIIIIPVIVFFSLIIIIDSPGNPFYVQERMGLMGRKFKIIKLRSMRLDAEKNGAQWAKQEDPRITKVGRFLRKTRIDELPQIWNVIKGDMSLIGPRPERPIFVEEFSQYIHNFPKRLEIKPGLTGWAQVNGGYDIDPEAKLKLDLYYINNCNVIMDIKILLKTINIVLTGEGAR